MAKEPKSQSTLKKHPSEPGWYLTVKDKSGIIRTLFITEVKNVEQENPGEGAS